MSGITGDKAGSGRDPKWGIFDTKDDVWLGNDDGPKLFDDELIARVAAEMADIQLRQECGRCVAKLVPVECGRPTLRDELPVEISRDRAMRLLEYGYLSKGKPQ